MADVLSLREKISRIENAIDRLSDVRDMLENAQQERAALQREGEVTTDIETILNTRLGHIETIADQIGTDLGNLTYTYDNLVQIGTPGNYLSASIAHTAKTITAVGGGSPFGVFDAGDVLKLESAEDTENNGEWTVSTATGTVLTMTTNLGATNTEDKSIKISLKER